MCYNRHMGKEIITFEEFYKITNKKVYKFIYTLARRDKEIAEDIFQNTMINAEKYLRKLESTEKLEAWAFTIAKNETRRYFHKNKNKINSELYILDDEKQQLQNSESAPDFANDVVNEDFVRQLLNGVDTATQQVLLLHYFYDMTLVSIAETLDIKLNTIKSIHRRGLAKLKKIIEDGR